MMLKKLFEQKKMLLRHYCKTGHHLVCNPSIPRREKLQLWQEKWFEEHSWEEFGSRLYSNYLPENTLFWPAICRLRGKSFSTSTSIRDSDGNSLRDVKEDLSPWRECFEDLLNSVKATALTHAIRLILGKRKPSYWQWQKRTP